MLVPPISRATLTFFRLIARVWFQLHFTSVLTLDTAPFTSASPSSPLIVYGNHSSWWDPMIAVLLAAKLLPGREHFAPMDASSLAHNRLLRQIGIFPVELHAPSGARQFLATSAAVLAAKGVLWVTPQGRFADTREHLLSFRPGLAALIARHPGCTLLPLATEYTFWDQRQPLAFAHFGQPVLYSGSDRAGSDKTALTQQLEAALTRTMDELKTQVLTRNPANFQRLRLWQ